MFKSLFSALLLSTCLVNAQSNEPLTFSREFTVSGKSVLISLLMYSPQDDSGIRGAEFLYSFKDQSTTCSYNFFYCLIRDTSVYLSNSRETVYDDNPEAYLSQGHIRFVSKDFFLCKPDQETLVMESIHLTEPKEEIVIVEVAPVKKRTGDPNDVIVDFAENDPEFPGGETAMRDFVSHNLVVPEGLETSVFIYVQFVIRKDGSVTDATILRGSTPEVNEEVLRVVYLMPDWKPATHNGKPVSIRYSMPVRIEIH